MAVSGKIKILAVVGPTASGKTALSIRLAQRLNGEIVSCDSMQVYRRMNVGTAKPSEDEKCGVPHHLIDVADPHEPYSVAAYVEAANEAVMTISQKGKVPIFCGGTGLYLDSFLRGGFEETTADPALRQALFAFAEEQGAHALHERLRAVDPQSAEEIHENNVKRVVRALEIYESTGLTKTETDRRSKTRSVPWEATVVGLHYPDRELLYERIGKRIRIMLDDGLLEETRMLFEEGIFQKNLTAAQAIGYKELFGYLQGEEPLESAIERLTYATRHYAKRQLTWFRAKDYVQWVNMADANGMRSLDAICDEVAHLFGVAP